MAIHFFLVWFLTHIKILCYLVTYTWLKRVKVKGFLVLLNREADRTFCIHPSIHTLIHLAPHPLVYTSDITFCIHPSIHTLIHLAPHPLVYTSDRTFCIHPSIHTLINLAPHPLVYTSDRTFCIHPSIHTLIHLAPHPLVYTSDRTFCNHPSIHTLIHLAYHPLVYTCTQLTVINELVLSDMLSVNYKTNLPWSGVWYVTYSLINVTF